MALVFILSTSRCKSLASSTDNKEACKGVNLILQSLTSLDFDKGNNFNNLIEKINLFRVYVNLIILQEEGLVIISSAYHVKKEILFPSQ